MSKLVFVAPPAHGHVNPTLPLMQELVQRGEQVSHYNTEEFRPQVEQTGATFRTYPPTEMSTAELSRLLQQGNLATITGLVLRETDNLLPFLVDELGREAPDLVVFDSLALWGKMATTLLGLRGAASITHFILDETQVPMVDILRLLPTLLPKVPGIWMARRHLVRKYGAAFPSHRSLFPMRDRLNLVFTTRELQPHTPLINETFRFVGPSINPQLRDGDFPLDSLGAGPIVYISLGTVHHTHVEFFRTCLAAFAEYPAQFILAVGNQTDLGALGPTPGNFGVRPWVPQLEVLQRTDVFITHGGMNSIHEGLYYGVPLIMVPHTVEQLLNARCVAGRGAGLIIDRPVRRQPVTAQMLREALDTLLATPQYRAAAEEVRRSLHATGGYRQAADELQAYIAESQGKGAR